MSRDDLKIVKYQPEFRDGVVELQKYLWGPETEMNAAYLDWKHLHNPYVSEPLVYLAICGERVIGMRGFFGTKWQFGSPRQTLVVPCAGDLVVAYEFRNRGVVTQIMKASLQDLASKGYSYVLSTGAGPITLLSQMAMGWRSIGSLQALRSRFVEKKPFSRVRKVPKRSRPIVSAYRRMRGLDRKPSSNDPASPPTPFDAFDTRVNLLSHRINAHVSVERAPRPQAMAELIARIGDDERIRHVRDEQYFMWRYQNPRAWYRFLFWGDAQLQGYLVLHAHATREESRFLVVDWEGTSHQVRAELMHTLFQIGGFEWLTIWAGTLREEDRRTLAELGFQPMEEKINSHRAAVLVRPVREDMMNREWLLGDQRLLDLKNWDLRIIYAEGY